MLHHTHLPMAFPVKQVWIHYKVYSLLKCMNSNSLTDFHVYHCAAHIIRSKQLLPLSTTCSYLGGFDMLHSKKFGNV